MKSTVCVNNLFFEYNREFVVDSLFRVQAHVPEKASSTRFHFSDKSSLGFQIVEYILSYYYS